MDIDANTKFIARLHTQPNARGLNIYNPYFEETGTNALYVLFYGPDPKKLMNGIRDLNFVGGNTAGFETDHGFAKLIDNFDSSSKFVGHVGYLKNIDGKFVAFYQGGEGLLAAISAKYDLEGKEIVIVGAGNVAGSIIFTMQNKGIKPKKVTLINRTTDKGMVLKKRLTIIDEVKPLSGLNDCKGDILINATPIGVTQPDELYTKDIVNKFETVTDVTFEKEDTNLIDLARKLNKTYITGWDFFTYQGKVMLENLLDTKIDAKVLKKYVEKGLKSVI